jgi:NDP-sugar pyrophosphorylase family protein
MSFHLNCWLKLMRNLLVCLLRTANGKENKVLSYPLHEYWLDIGHMEDYNRAQRDIINLDFGKF